MSGLNLAVKFLLELAALAAFAYAGYRVGPNLWLSIAFAVVFALIAAALWGAFAAPKSRYRLNELPRLIFETCFFAVASAALALVGDIPGGAVMFVLYALNAASLRAR